MYGNGWWGRVTIGLLGLTLTEACGYSADLHYGKEVLPGIMVLTSPESGLSELADPYTTFQKDSVLISGTAPYALRFRAAEDIARGGPYEIIWNDFHYADGTALEGNRVSAHTWDMKPAHWVDRTPGSARLWDPAKDKEPPVTVWYGGRMRPYAGAKTSRWPIDNYSRDVFSFVEKTPGKWFSLTDSIFSSEQDWPRAFGNYLGHRYGHQIIMRNGRPVVFFEEVTDIRADGSPSVTRIFMDEMTSPYQASGKAVELISPFHPETGKPFPSAVREDKAVLVEGPLYFRFRYAGEEWEAIGFSAGSYYAKYPSCFASRKVADGLAGKPYQVDLTDDGTDLHDAGAELGKSLDLIGGPARPAVIVSSDGNALLSSNGRLQVLVHGYRKSLRSFRIVIHAPLDVAMGPKGVLRFKIAPSRVEKPITTGGRLSLRALLPELPV